VFPKILKFGFELSEQNPNDYKDEHTNVKPIILCIMGIMLLIKK